MKKVILDCDNTTGIVGCDVDDGLTFFYLYGHPQVELLGVTTSFANSSRDIVYNATKSMLEELNISDIPIYKGCMGNGNYDCEAAEFLVKQVSLFPGEISLLVTGATSNIYAAYLKDKKFFQKLKEIIFMGGICEPIFKMNDIVCNEINFSGDAKATEQVLLNGNNITVMCAETTQHSYYGDNELARIEELDNRLSRYLVPILKRWIAIIGAKYKNKYFNNWDICTAISRIINCVM